MWSVCDEFQCIYSSAFISFNIFSFVLHFVEITFPISAWFAMALFGPSSLHCLWTMFNHNRWTLLDQKYRCVIHWFVSCKHRCSIQNDIWPCRKCYTCIRVNPGWLVTWSSSVELFILCWFWRSLWTKAIMFHVQLHVPSASLPVTKRLLRWEDRRRRLWRRTFS